MTIVTMGLDLAKSVFQAHGVDKSGAAVLVKKLHRKQMLGTVRNLCGRPVSLLSHKSFAEHHGELGPCLSPFPRRPFPVFRSVVENKV